MSWAYFRSRNGHYDVYKSVADAAGSTDVALLAAVCADLTAGAGGPFVRHIRASKPLWSDLVPMSEWNLRSALTFLFDETPRPTDPITTIQHYAHRTGPRKSIYHFNHPEILKAYTELALSDRHGSTAVTPGRYWWEGPVEQLISDLVKTLRSAGVTAGYTDLQVQDAVTLVLEEEHTKTQLGILPRSKDMRNILFQYVRNRYQYEPGTRAYKLLVFDVFWATMKRITGIRDKRPLSAVDPKLAFQLQSQISAVLRRLHEADMSPETYMRAYKDICETQGKQPELRDFLKVPEHLFLLK